MTKFPIKKVELKEEGVSTLAPRQIWFDTDTKRLNADGLGILLGSFKGEDKILTINKKGEAKLVSFELSNRFDEELEIIEKWKPTKPISCVYYDAEKDRYFVKRFLLEDTFSPQAFYTLEDDKSSIKVVSTDYLPVIELIFPKIKGLEKDPEVINVEEFITVKGIKAQGNQLTTYKLKQINVLAPLPFDEPDEIEEEVEDDTQPTLFDTIDEDNNEEEILEE